MSPGEVSHRAVEICRCVARSRRCLLKGCEQPYHPKSLWSRYCSAECREAARRWCVARARKRYLQSAGGRAHRASQSREYRQRCTRLESNQEVTELDEPCRESEGDQRKKTFVYEICARPGCYECPGANGYSPLVKFCSRNCFRALRRVKQREARLRRLRSQ